MFRLGKQKLNLKFCDTNSLQKLHAQITSYTYFFSKINKSLVHARISKCHKNPSSTIRSLCLELRTSDLLSVLYSLDIPLFHSKEALRCWNLRLSIAILGFISCDYVLRKAYSGWIRASNLKCMSLAFLPQQGQSQH